MVAGDDTRWFDGCRTGDCTFIDREPIARTSRFQTGPNLYTWDRRIVTVGTTANPRVAVCHRRPTQGRRRRLSTTWSNRFYVVEKPTSSKDGVSRRPDTDWKAFTNEASL
jgi:hypothetical protein